MGGAALKGARLNYLRDLWVREARALPGIEILTPDDPRLYCTITSLRFTHTQDQQPLVDRLLRDYNLFTTLRQGAAFGSCIRITPGFTTPLAHIQLLSNALGELAQP